jgi:protein-tyrosine-phosphatase
MAEALWSEASEVPAASAGTRPASSTHPLAIDAVRKAGLHATQSPQAVANTLQPGDLVVTVCDQAHEGWGEAGTPARPDLHWSIPDPAASASPAAFAQALALLRQRVAALVPYVRPMGMEQAQ